MDPNTLSVMQGAAGAAGGDPVYVEDVFSTFLYDGADAAQTIVNGIDLAGEGGMVIQRRRNVSGNWFVNDTENGANNFIYTNSADVLGVGTTGSSFNSNGFTIGGENNLHNAGNDVVSYSFRKAPGFFDVVTYTGNGTAGKTISHNLGSAPGMILIKDLDAENWWLCYHRGMGNTKAMYFNSTHTESEQLWWNDTDPTSTEFTVGIITGNNADGHDYVAYLFAHDDQQFGAGGNESIIKCGSYTGTTSGVDLDLGFEPQWVMIKRATGTATSYTNWVMLDNMRGVVTGGTDIPLAANLSTAENGTYLYGSGNPANLIEFSPTGIRVDPGGSQFSSVCTNGETYVYTAIRRGPMKTPEAATEVFAIDTDSASSTIPTWDSGFPVDMAFTLDTLGGTGAQKNSARLLGSKYLVTSSNTDEASDGSLVWDSNEGWGKDYDSNRVWYSWMFKRAPGFFDVVCYDGTGSAHTEAHNLGVVPEMMIVKKRSSTAHWRVYHSATGNNKYSPAFRTDPFYTSSSSWNDTTPTSTQFTLGTEHDVNDPSDTFVAYLFATLPGISKVGSYSGTGSDVDVDCGFTSGARFVLIKRSDTETQGYAPDRTNWYLWDSTRGIVSGDDPWFTLNETHAEQTGDDFIDPLSSGFTVTSTGGGLNTSGGTYIYLAIA